MPKDLAFYKDIEFFEKEFDGIMPLEVVIDTKRKNGVLKLSTLKKMQNLEELLADNPELSKPISILNLVKYSKQVYYNNNPKYYQLPSSQERNFILPYAKSFGNDKGNLLKAYIDSTGQYARMTTFMKDVGTEEMERIETTLAPKLTKLFPSDRYDVSFTGKALIFQKGTTYLVKNLVFSLTLAIILIAIFMAWMFRSFQNDYYFIDSKSFTLVDDCGNDGLSGSPYQTLDNLSF